MRRHTLLFAILLSTGASAPAADVHVDIYHGDDATGTGAPTNPYRTITLAMLLAQGGDHVLVAPGVYSPANGELYPLFLPPGVDLTGVGGAANTVLDGAGVSWGSQAGMILMGGDGAVSGFTFRNGPTQGWWDAAIANWGSGNVSILGNVFAGPNMNRAVVLYDLGADPTSTSSATIAHNVAYSIGPADAFLAFDYPQVLIAHNTVVEGTRSGIACSQINSIVGGIIANNHFSKQGFFALELNAPGLQLINNNFYLNSVGPITGTFGSQTGSLSVVPAFVSSLGHDYHLQPVSPLVDQGAPLSLVSDFEGDPLGFGAASDVGADEVVLPGVGVRAPYEIGAATALNTTGAAGASYAQLMGVAPAAISTPYGVLAFDPTVTIVLGVGTLPASGVAVTLITVPAVPASVLGFPLITQSLVGFGVNALSAPKRVAMLQ